MKNDFQEKIDDKDKKNYEKLLDEQINLCQDEENCKYIFRIDNYKYDEKQNKFIINYNFKEITQNISQEAKSLSQVQLKTLEEKLNIFDQLLELAEFLKKKKIIHNNIKKNNLILYNNKLYLTDFGYLQGKDKSNIFMDQKNFVRTLNQDQQRQIYPYQSQKLLEILNNYYLKNEELMEKLEQRTQEDIQDNDQHVLTVLMFEIFYPFDLADYYLLKNSLDLSKKPIRNQQLGWMIGKNTNVQYNVLLIIQKILIDRFSVGNVQKQNSQKIQSDNFFQIDRNLINIYNQILIQEYFKHKILEFDQQFLYYFTYQELQKLLNQISNQQYQFEQDLKQAIEKIQKLYDKIDKNEFNKENFKQLELEEQFICLVYLDQKIDEFDINQNQDQYQEVKKLLDYYTLKYKLKEFYDEVNNKQQKDFKFNSIKIKLKIQQYKINKEKLINIKNNNKQLADEQIEKEILEFVQQLLYYFTYKEIKNILNQFQNPQNKFQKDLKQEIEKIQKLYDKIDKNEFNKENFKQLELEEQFICLVYLDQKIDEFDINQNQDQYQEVKKLLDYYTLKQELKEFYVEINDKQQKDFNFNNLKKQRFQYLIDEEKQNLVQEYFKHKILEFDQQLLYYFTYKEIKKILNQFQNPQNKFQKDLKLKIEKIQKFYDMIDKNEFNKENFKQLELEEKFICLVYLDQKIDEFDCDKNQDQSQEVDRLLDYYNLKYELKEFYDEVNNKQQKDFKFNNPIKIKYGNQFLYEYINQITLRLQSDKYLVQQVDLNNMILNIPNQEQQQIEFKQIKQDKNTFQFIIHKFFLQNDLYYCKYLEVKEQKRNFEPMVIMNFNLIKEYRFEDYNSKVRLIDHKKKFKYFGEYQLDEQGEIKFNGQGTKEILEKDKEILETGQVFKVKGNFKNNQLNGKSITFYHHYDESKITFSIGEYKDGQMSGQHIHYPVNDQKILKTTYHWKFLKYFNYYFETG